MTDQPTPEPVARLTYHSAVTLWENEPASVLHEMWNLSDSVSLHDKVAIVLAGTGMKFQLFLNFFFDFQLAILLI